MQGGGFLNLDGITKKLDCEGLKLSLFARHIHRHYGAHCSLYVLNYLGQGCAIPGKCHRQVNEEVSWLNCISH